MSADAVQPFMGVVTLALLIAGVVFIEIIRTVRRYLKIAPAADWRRGSPAAGSPDESGFSADHLFLLHAERFLDSQFTANETFDTKASASLGVGSTVLPLTFGLLAVSARTPPAVTTWCLAIAVLAYVILLAFVIRAVHIRGFEFRPTLQSMADSSQTYDAAVMRRWLADEYSVSATLNRPILERKARYVGWAYIALLVERGVCLLDRRASLALLAGVGRLLRANVRWRRKRAWRTDHDIGGARRRHWRRRWFGWWGE